MHGPRCALATAHRHCQAVWWTFLVISSTGAGSVQADLRCCVSSFGYTLKSSTVGYVGVFNFCCVCLDSGSLFVALVGLELLICRQEWS